MSGAKLTKYFLFNDDIYMKLVADDTFKMIQNKQRQRKWFVCSNDCL